LLCIVAVRLALRSVPVDAVWYRLHLSAFVFAQGGGGGGGGCCYDEMEKKKDQPRRLSEVFWGGAMPHVSAALAGKSGRRPIHVPLDDDDDVQFVGHCPADFAPSPSAPLAANVSTPSNSIPSAALRRLKCFGLAAVLISKIASCARTTAGDSQTPDRHLCNVLAAGDSRNGLRAIVIERLRCKSQVECARALHARVLHSARCRRSLALCMLVFCHSFHM